MAGLAFDGVLQLLAGLPGAGPDLCANAHWNAINGHGAKAASTPFAVHVGDGITVYGTLSLLGALNQKNGTTGLGMNEVCNELAGTRGLEAPLALRTYAGLS